METFIQPEDLHTNPEPSSLRRHRGWCCKCSDDASQLQSRERTQKSARNTKPVQRPRKATKLRPKKHQGVCFQKRPQLCGQFQPQKWSQHPTPKREPRRLPKPYGFLGFSGNLYNHRFRGPYGLLGFSGNGHHLQQPYICLGILIIIFRSPMSS